MSKGYKARRRKLKAHDKGIDRHEPGVAHHRKRARLQDQHARDVGAGAKRRKPPPAR